MQPVVAATTTLQNFCLHQFRSLPWRDSLDDYTHLGSLRELMWAFTFTSLVYCTQVFPCWCLSHACDRVLVMLKAFASYVFVVFAMKESVELTHRVTFIVAQASYQSCTINHECHGHRLHCRSVMLNMCVWWLVGSSSSHASVCSYDHLCIFRLFTQLVIFVEVLMTRLLINSQTVILLLTWSTVNQNNTEAPSYFFQVALPTRIVDRLFISGIAQCSRASLPLPISQHSSEIVQIWSTGRPPDLSAVLPVSNSHQQTTCSLQELRSFCCHWMSRQLEVPSGNCTVLAASDPRIQLEVPSGNCVVLAANNPSSQLTVPSGNCAVLAASDPSSQLAIPFGNCVVLAINIPGSSPEKMHNPCLLTFHAAWLGPLENCTKFGCPTPVDFSFQKMHRECLPCPPATWTVPPKNLHNFSSQPSQTFQIVTVDSNHLSPSPSDSCTVFISSCLKTLSHITTLLPLSVTCIRKIMCHGRLGGFWFYVISSWVILGTRTSTNMSR